MKRADAYRGTLAFALVLGGVGAGVGTAVGSLFETFPWKVPVTIFLALLFYGLCRASYEESQEASEKVKSAKGERDEWKGKYEELFAKPDAEDSLPYPPPRKLPPESASKSHLVGESFRLTELLTPEESASGHAIQDRIFVNCTIHGPVILMPDRNSRSRFIRSTFAEKDEPGYPDSMFYELGSKRLPGWFSGVVGIERCVFRECTFVDIGIVADSKTLQEFKEHVTGKGDANIGFS